VALGGGHTSEARRIGFYGRRIGRAFQIIDDVFDIAKSLDDTGKLPGTDLARKRLSLPIIYAMNELGPEHIVSRIMKGASFTQAELVEGLAAIRHSQGFVQSLLDARSEIIDSMRYLDTFPDNEYRAALNDIAYYIVNRRY
jgi:heptaprenyl diphosphate synthase